MPPSSSHATVQARCRQQQQRQERHVLGDLTPPFCSSITLPFGPEPPGVKGLPAVYKLATGSTSSARQALCWAPQAHLCSCQSPLMCSLSTSSVRQGLRTWPHHTLANHPTLCSPPCHVLLQCKLIQGSTGSTWGASLPSGPAATAPARSSTAGTC